MTYSDLAIYAVLLAVMLDLYIIKSQMLTRGIYWMTWALILPFQLLTNSWLTTNEIVIYSPEQIIGRRLAGAPVEDLLFGFSMILLTLSLWERFKPRDTTSNKEELKPGQEIER